MILDESTMGRRAARRLVRVCSRLLFSGGWDASAGYAHGWNFDFQRSLPHFSPD